VYSPFGDLRIDRDQNWDSVQRLFDGFELVMLNLRKVVVDLISRKKIYMLGSLFHRNESHDAARWNVQSLVRHADIKTTLQTYTHANFEKAMMAQGQMLEAILNPSLSSRTE
jgi:hypothetical protein